MSAFINWLSQIAVVSFFNLRTLPQRLGSSAAALFGIAGVVAVLVGVLSIAHGFRRAMTVAAFPENVMVLRGGSDSEMMSILMGEDVRIIADAPAIARREGRPLASAELFVIINLPKRSTGTDANVPMRGIEMAAFDVRPEVQIIQGRRFQPGRNEVVVGRAAAFQFAGLQVGDKLKVGKNEWTVVGQFTANGSVSESEIWTEAPVLQSAYQRGNSYQAVYAKLTSAAAFQQFKDALTSDPRLNVKVIRQSDYYQEQSTLLYNIITGLGTLVASLMAVGAVFGALNTMYTAVADRTREIATLRALGFSRLPIIISVLFESLLLAVAGGLLGGGLAYFAFDGFRAATINWQSFSQVAFAFQVTPGLLVQGIVYAVLIGLIGGLFPAIRAARLPIAAALREL